MPEAQQKFRDLQDMSDSDEEVHPNIDAKSYHRFVREENKRRLEFLRSKTELTPSELKEKEKLEYKNLPVLVEINEGETFRKSEDLENIDYSEDLLWLLNNSEIKDLLDLLDRKTIGLEKFEDLIYYNLSESIKEGDDDMGWSLCRIGLLIKWIREFGKGYMVRIASMDQCDLQHVFDSHYFDSKKAILRLQ